MDSSDEAVETQRKRLLYQSHHRGTKESDLFLGAFAGEYLPQIHRRTVEPLRNMLTENDNNLFDWI